jgi:hypothetical protein
MADNALLQALMGGQTSSAGQLASARYLPSESAWGIGANAVGQVAPLLNNPYASTGSNLGITIGSALFAGLLSGMAKNEANDSNANMFKLAGGAYNVPAADRASIVEQEPRLAPFVAALNQQERDNAIEQARERAKKMLEYDPAVLQGEGTKAAMIKQGEIQGTIAGAGGNEANVPGTPGYQKNQDQITAERMLSNDFRNVAEPFKYKEQGLKAVTEAYKDKQGTSDYELIRRGAQAVEPSLAVRKDDQDSIQGAASVLGVAYGTLQNAISGSTKLTDEVRDGIMRMVQRSYDSSLQDYNTMHQSFTDRATSHGLSPNLVVPYQVGKPFNALYPDLAAKIGTGSVAGASGQGDPAAAQAEIQRRLAAGMNQMQNVGAIP